MTILAQSAASHADVNQSESELGLEISLQDVRMAMQDCGVLAPEKTLVEQEYDDEEDTRGVEAFIAWAKGPANMEIRRIALDGPEGAKDDYLTGIFPQFTALCMIMALILV